MRSRALRAATLAALSLLARTALGATLPDGFALPAGFGVDEKASKAYDFSHEPISYSKQGGPSVHIDPEGKTWWILMGVTPANKTADATDAAMRASLEAQGWELYTPRGTLVAHRTSAAGKEQWFKGSAASGDYRATILEVGPAPHSLALPPPAATPEKFGDGDDFPYLLKFPGSTLTRTAAQPGKSFDVTPPGGAKEQLAGPPTLDKIYDLPPSVSTYEFMVVYRDALAKARWNVIRTAASSDALVVAHYAQKGRDLFCYLHGGTFSVADIGAANEAQRLAEALAKEGHIAVYGIYFDSDRSTLRPDSEAALQHILELLRTDAKLAVEIQGHTDNTGTATHNLTLSDARAASVRTWVLDHGIADSRLTAKGFGDTRPVADNKTPEGRAKNRRVELAK